MKVNWEKNLRYILLNEKIKVQNILIYKIKFEQGNRRCM